MHVLLFAMHQKLVYLATHHLLVFLMCIPTFFIVQLARNVSTVPSL